MGGNRRWIVLPVVGSAEFDGYPGIMRALNRWAATPGRLGPDPHKFLEPIDLIGFDLNSPLSLGAALKVIDGDRLSTDHKRSGIRVGEPLIQRRPRYAESPGRFVRG